MQWESYDILDWLYITMQFFFGFRPWQAGGACAPEGTRDSLNQGSALSDATIVPQGNVVADMTHSEDKLILIPGNAVGTATAHWHPSVLLEHKKD